jgi:hypothetical protein
LSGFSAEKPQSATFIFAQVIALLLESRQHSRDLRAVQSEQAGNNPWTFSRVILYSSADRLQALTGYPSCHGTPPESEVVSTLQEACCIYRNKEDFFD